jgi:hypothetical protein
MPLKSITITKDPELTLCTWLPLRVPVPPPGKPTVTVSPLRNPLPNTVTFWFPEVGGGTAGEILEMLCPLQIPRQTPRKIEARHGKIAITPSSIATNYSDV